MAKPTLEEITDSIAYHTNRWSTAHANMVTWQGWADEGAPAGMVPDGYAAYKQPLGYMVKGAVAQLITANPVIKVTSTRRGETGPKIAEAVKLFCETSLKWADKQARASLPKELARNGLVKGLGVLRAPIFDQGAWGDPPKPGDEDAEDAYKAVQESCWPHRWDAIDPVVCSPFDDGKGIVVVSKRLVSDILVSFSEWDYGTLKLSDEVDFTEWYDGQWRCFLASNEPILKSEIQPCTAVPYQWFYSSFGANHRGAKPEERAKGIFAELESTFTHQNNLLTAYFADISNRIYGRFKQLRGSNVDWAKSGPGGVVTVNDMGDVEELKQPMSAPDLTLALGMLSGVVETSTYSRALLGQGSQPTATQEGMTLAQARLGFEPFLDSIEQVLAEALAKACYDFKDSPYITSIPLGTVMLKQTDITRPVLIEVDLMPVDSDKDDRLQQAAIQHKQAGTLSTYTIQKDFLKRDPDEETRQSLKEAALLSPATLQAIINMAMEKATAKVEINRAREMRKRMGAGVQPTTQPGEPQPEQIGEEDSMASQVMAGRMNQETGRGMEGEMQTTPERSAQMNPDQMLRMASRGRIPNR
ncbi:MAG: hypothetical protein Q7T04_00690 [Dehalococcoidia bacterium]|nr:hypothetical protein [Dehalococcoidia bacterium]